FKASKLSAGADFVVIKKRNMAEFSRKSVIPSEKPSVNDQAESDSPSDIHYHNISGGFGSQRPEFCQGDNTRVIIHIHRKVQPFYQIISDGKLSISGMNILVGVIHSFLNINKTRHTNSHTCYFILSDSRFIYYCFNIFCQ